MAYIDKIVVNGEEVASSKPVYMHGIDLSNGTTNSILLHIISTDSALINSLDKLKAYAESFVGRLVIQTNGVIVINNTPRTIMAIIKSASNSYEILYIGDSGFALISNADLTNYFNVVNDSVHIIH